MELTPAKSSKFDYGISYWAATSHLSKRNKSLLPQPFLENKFSEVDSCASEQSSALPEAYFFFKKCHKMMRKDYTEELLARFILQWLLISHNIGRNGDITLERMKENKLLESILFKGHSICMKYFLCLSAISLEPIKYVSCLTWWWFKRSQEADREVKKSWHSIFFCQEKK